jgi:hypothetical protein
LEWRAVALLQHKPSLLAYAIVNSQFYSSDQQHNAWNAFKELRRPKGLPTFTAAAGVTKGMKTQNMTGGFHLRQEQYKCKLLKTKYSCIKQQIQDSKIHFQLPKHCNSQHLSPVPWFAYSSLQ